MGRGYDSTVEMLRSGSPRRTGTAAPHAGQLNSTTSALALILAGSNRMGAEHAWQATSVTCPVPRERRSTFLHRHHSDQGNEKRVVGQARAGLVARRPIRIACLTRSGNLPSFVFHAAGRPLLVIHPTMRQSDG
jgi:hypothetical protein